MDIKQESKGALYAILFGAGLIACVAGLIMLMNANMIGGNIIWVLGAALILWSIIMSKNDKQVSNLKTVNMIMKIVVLCILGLFWVMNNYINITLN